MVTEIYDVVLIRWVYLRHQVFVANPNKQDAIRSILLRNQDKLVEFLTNFHNDRSEDEQFNDEKAYLIKQIRELKPLEGDQATSAADWSELIIILSSQAKI